MNSKIDAMKSKTPLLIALLVLAIAVVGFFLYQNNNKVKEPNNIKVTQDHMTTDKKLSPDAGLKLCFKSDSQELTFNINRDDSISGEYNTMPKGGEHKIGRYKATRLGNALIKGEYTYSNEDGGAKVPISLELLSEGIKITLPGDMGVSTLALIDCESY